MKIATSKINYDLLYLTVESRVMPIITQDFDCNFYIEFVPSPLYAFGGKTKMATWFKL